MNSDEERRINQLLFSVEQEEASTDYAVEKPTGPLVRQLFADVSDNEQNSDSEDDDGYWDLQEIREVDENVEDFQQ